LDVGKADHHATVLDAAGEVVFDRSLRNDEQALECLLADAGPAAALVIDQPGSIGALAVAVARRREVPVAYVPGLVMRRASELCRTGNHRLNDALWLSAFCALHHPPARDYYARKRGEGKRHNAASSALPAADAISSTGCSAPALPTANCPPARPAPPDPNFS
jgi:hypothetical protein